MSLVPQSLTGLPSWWQQFGGLVDQYAAQYGVDPALVAAVIEEESGGNPNARSPAGANGLMQVVGGPFDPAANIQLGTSILARDINQFGLILGLAAYNAGPGNVEKYGMNITNPIYLISQGWSSSDAYQVYHYITQVPALLAQFEQWLIGKTPPPVTTPPPGTIPPPGSTPYPGPAPVQPPGPLNPYQITIPLPTGPITIDLSSIVTPFVQIGESIGQLPQTLINIVNSVERFGFIVLGIVIMLVGVWVLSRSEPEQVREVQ